jgi:agmatinase
VKFFSAEALNLMGKTYNPSDVGMMGSIFGYPYLEDESELIIIPVPWDVTVSYRSGAAKGPQAILDASPQLDLSLFQIVKPWNYSACMQAPVAWIRTNAEKHRAQAAKVIASLENGEKPEDVILQEVNVACQLMIDHVKAQSKQVLESGKIAAVLGGDHSTPLGLIAALSERMQFAILQIDAHMDLREAYEGFTYSHASIMYNALKMEGVQSLVQVGIRDFCQEELDYIAQTNQVIHTFYDDEIKTGLLRGQSWLEWTEKIINKLPENVYISFDIDGLAPSLCPNTGTPVPGGLSFEQVTFLLMQIVKSGKKIIGFDLSEVAPGHNEWDANVGARILYRLIAMTGISQGKISLLA